MDSQKKADSLRFLFLYTKRTRPFQAGPFVARHINNWSSGPILIALHIDNNRRKTACIRLKVKYVTVKSVKIRG